MEDLILAGQTFLPAAVFVALAAAVTVAVRWTWRRQARPGYAPLWALAYVLLIVAGATVAGLVVHGFPGAGRRRAPVLPPGS